MAADTLTERLRPHVEALKADDAAGCAKARAVISLHRMWVSCPSDHAAPALCEAAFEDWLKTQRAT
jgi:hypothetical protein